jgi:hypothetical protein
MPHPLQFLNAFPEAIQVNAENVCAHIESGFRDDLIFFDMLEAGHRELFYFKPRSHRQVGHNGKKSPTKDGKKYDGQRDFGESDERG